MKESTKRINEITKWLLASPLLRQEAEGDYRVLKGQIVKLEDDVYIDLYRWLSHEGFEDGTSTLGFYVRHEKEHAPDGNDSEVIYFRKAFTVSAPFALEKPFEYSKPRREFFDGDEEDVPF